MNYWNLLNHSRISIRKAICLTLVASLFFTSCPGLEAAPVLLASPRYPLSMTLIGRMNTEALMARETFIHSVDGRTTAAWSFLKSSSLLTTAHSARMTLFQKIKRSWRGPTNLLSSESTAQTKYTIPEHLRGFAIPQGRTQLVMSVLTSLAVGFLLSYLTTRFFALPAGVALGCGNYIAGGFRPVLKILKSMKKPVRRLAGRGIQSLGALAMLPFLEKIPKDAIIPGFEVNKKIVVWRFVGRKEWFFKREDAIKRFFDIFLKVVQAQLKNVWENYSLLAYSIKLHSRFATTGSKDQTVDELIEAAQPAGLPGHWSLRWQIHQGPEGPEQVPEYVWVEHSFQFNGDVNKTRRLQLKMADDHVLGNQALRDWLVQWMGVDPADVPPGDAPLVGMMQELFFTQGLWGASMRYALAIHVTSPGDKKAPPLEAIKSWEPFFHHAYQDFIHNVRPEMLTVSNLNDITDAQAAAFADYLKQIIAEPDRKKMQRRANYEGISTDTLDDIRTTLGPDLDVFLRASTMSFFRNSLPYAVMHEILPRIEGTTGGDFSSTLNPPGSPDMHVTICFGQGIVVTFSKDGKFFSISSDRSVQKLMPPDDAYEKLVLDYRSGEVLVLGMQEDQKIHVAVYSGPNKEAQPEQAIRSRMKPMNDPVDGDTLDAPQDPLFSTYPMEAELKRTVPLLKTVHEEWDQVRAGATTRNSQTASEINRLLIQMKIYEAVRSRTGVNERDLPADIDDSIWNDAERLSRESWLRTMNESQILEAVQNVADEVTEEIIHRALPRKDPESVLSQIRGVLENRSGDGVLDRLKKITVLAVNAFHLGSKGGPLEQDTYDMVVIGTEKNEYAMEQFATNLKETLGIRAKMVSGNEYLEMADRYRDDMDGFLRALQLNSKRSIAIVASDSAETFEIGIDGGWAAATMQECFSWTGGKDNRLVDIVEKNRSLHNHNPSSPDEAHLAAYSASLETATELLMFLGENTSSRFKTGGSDYAKAPFFQTPWESKDFAVWRDSNNNFIQYTVPEVLGYTAAGHAITGAESDSAKLRGLGKHLAGRQLESIRVKILVWSYLFLTVVLAGSGLGAFSMHGVSSLGLHLGSGLESLSHFAGGLRHAGFGSAWALGHMSQLVLWLVGSPTGLRWTIAARISDWLIYGGFGLISLTGMRWVRLLLGWSKTPVLAGFGPPIFLITDSHRFVQQFLALYWRTGLGLSYGINSAPIFHASTLDAVDEFKTATRRWVVLIGRPDGQFDELLFSQAAAEMLGRQNKSILTLPYRWMKYLGIKPVSAEVITYGSHDPDPNEWEAMAQDQHVVYGKQNVLRTLDGSPVPAHVVRVYSNTIDAFTRLLGGARIITTQVQNVAHHFPTFPEDRSHTNTAVKSTAGPAPGDRVLAILQQASHRLVRIFSNDEVRHYSQVPIVIETRPLSSWTPDLHVPSHPSTLPDSPSRPLTLSPNVRFQAPSPRPTRLETPPMNVGHSSEEDWGSDINSLELQAFLDLPEDEGRTSLLLKKEKPTVPQKPVSPKLKMLAGGKLSPKPEGMSEEMYKALSTLFKKNKDLNFEGLHIAVAQGMNRMMRYTSMNRVSVLFIDQDFVNDLIQGAVDPRRRHIVQGSIPVGVLELREEHFHFESDQNGKTLTKLDEEAFGIHLKLVQFLSWSVPLRQAAIKYLTSPETPFDSLNFGSRIYQLASDTYMAALKENLPKKGIVTDAEREAAVAAAIAKTLEVTKEPTLAYIHEAFAAAKKTVAADSPVQPILTSDGRGVVITPAQRSDATGPSPAPTFTSTVINRSASSAGKPAPKSKSFKINIRPVIQGLGHLWSWLAQTLSDRRASIRAHSDRRFLNFMIWGFSGVIILFAAVVIMTVPFGSRSQPMGQPAIPPVHMPATTVTTLPTEESNMQPKVEITKIPTEEMERPAPREAADPEPKPNNDNDPLGIRFSLNDLHATSVEDMLARLRKRALDENNVEWQKALAGSDAVVRLKALIKKQNHGDVKHIPPAKKFNLSTLVSSGDVSGDIPLQLQGIAGFIHTPWLALLSLFALLSAGPMSLRSRRLHQRLLFERNA